MAIVASAFRWLQRKRYQYEVTLSLYMLTPTEKFIFNSFIFLFISMILIAASLYLPQHITFLTNRAWFYYHGDEGLAALASTGLSASASSVTSTVAALAQKATGANLIAGRIPEGLVVAGRKPESAKGWNKEEL